MQLFLSPFQNIRCREQSLSWHNGTCLFPANLIGYWDRNIKRPKTIGAHLVAMLRVTKRHLWNKSAIIEWLVNVKCFPFVFITNQASMPHFSFKSRFHPEAQLKGSFPMLWPRVKRPEPMWLQPRSQPLLANNTKVQEEGGGDPRLTIVTGWFNFATCKICFDTHFLCISQLFFHGSSYHNYWYLRDRSLLMAQVGTEEKLGR